MKKDLDGPEDYLDEMAALASEYLTEYNGYPVELSGKEMQNEVEDIEKALQEFQTVLDDQEEKSNPTGNASGRWGGGGHR